MSKPAPGMTEGNPRGTNQGVACRRGGSRARPGSAGEPSGKQGQEIDALIKQWLKNRDTVLFLGVWEQLNKPGFNSLEFEGFRSQAELNRFSLPTPDYLQRASPSATPAFPRPISSSFGDDLIKVGRKREIDRQQIKEARRASATEQTPGEHFFCAGSSRLESEGWIPCASYKLRHAGNSWRR